MKQLLISSTRIQRSSLQILGVSAGLMTVACQGIETDHSSVKADNLLGRLSSSANAVCVKRSIGVATLERSGLQLAGNAKISGDILLTNRSPASLTGNAWVQGAVIAEDASRVSQSGNARVDGGISLKSLGREEDLLEKFAEELAELQATQTLPRLASDQLIEGRDGVNVIDVQGDINLSGKNTVTLKGSEKAVFIVNVHGGVKISGQAAIAVSGGVREQNVIFNAVGDGPSLSLSGQGVVSGTFLARERGVQISGNGTIKGAIIAGRDIGVTGNGLSIIPQAFCIDISLRHEGKEGEEGEHHDGDDCDGKHDGTSPSPTPSSSATPDPSPTPSSSVTPDPSPTPSSSVTPDPSPMPCTDLVCGGGVIGL